MEDKNELDRVKAEAYDLNRELNELRSVLSHLTQVLGLRGNVSIQDFVEEVKELKQRDSDKSEPPKAEPSED